MKNKKSICNNTMPFASAGENKNIIPLVTLNDVINTNVIATIHSICLLMNPIIQLAILV